MGCDLTRIKSKEEKRTRRKEAKFDDNEFEQMIKVFLTACFCNIFYFHP